MAALQVKSIEKLADTETPVSAYLKLCRGRSDSFLLESVETKEITGRFSIVAFDPIFTMQLEDDKVVSWGLNGKTSDPAADFFELIKKNLKNLECESLPDLPSIGSLMGFVGYDAVRLIEYLPSPFQSRMPTARLVFPSRFVVFDHLRRISILLAIGEDDATCFSKIKEMEQMLHSPLSFKSHKSSIKIVSPPKDRFCQAVRKGKEYIRAGDIFQVVLSDKFEGETDMDPFELYRRLRVRSPSPYMFYLDFGGYRLVGASPETLVKVNRDTVTIVPIAGTRGRSDDPKIDRELERELMESEKEFAEHIMLVDLARNDVGKVAVYDTVGVDPLQNGSTL